MRYHPLMSLLVIEQPTPEPKVHQCCCHDVRRQFGNAYTPRKPLISMFSTPRRWLLQRKSPYFPNPIEWVVAEGVQYVPEHNVLDWNGDESEMQDVLLCLPVANDGAPVPVGWDAI